MHVWDLPTRFFHWLIASLVAFSWASAEWHNMQAHLYAGLAALALLIFRLVWGVIGSNTARFSSFVRSPTQVLAYLKGGATGHHAAGHNPLGGYSVLALLALLALQIGTGLFATDTDAEVSGPLSHLVSYAISDGLAEVHEAAFNLLLAVIALHIVAIMFYRVIRRRNLVKPMITGRDPELSGHDGELVPAGPVRFMLAVLIASGITWAVAQGLYL